MEWKNEREMKIETSPDCSTQKMKYVIWRFIKAKLKEPEKYQKLGPRIAIL